MYELPYTCTCRYEKVLVCLKYTLVDNLPISKKFWSITNHGTQKLSGGKGYVHHKFYFWVDIIKAREETIEIFTRMRPYNQYIINIAYVM